MFLALAWIAGALAAAIDLNSADAAALETLPGIGPSKAAAIIAYRQAHGGFKSVEELDAVDGIGPSTMANVRDLVTVGGAPPAATVSKVPAPPAGRPGRVESVLGPGGGSCEPDRALADAKAKPATGCPVDINSADAAGLDRLPGIGEGKASAIIAYRAEHGKLASCDALDAVPGIGPATLSGLAECCVAR
jgi:competence protein ComEA